MGLRHLGVPLITAAVKSTLKGKRTRGGSVIFPISPPMPLLTTGAIPARRMCDSPQGKRLYRINGHWNLVRLSDIANPFGLQINGVFRLPENHNPR